jgi:hypothetical protein
VSIGLSSGLRLFAIGRYGHWCPGCDTVHFFNISSQDHPQGKKWDFNRDIDRPTFSPAMEIRDGAGEVVCRYFLTNGQLQFLDCKHEFRNRTVPLPAFPLVKR